MIDKYADRCASCIFIGLRFKKDQHYCGRSSVRRRDAAANTPDPDTTFLLEQFKNYEANPTQECCKHFSKRDPLLVSQQTVLLNLHYIGDSVSFLTKSREHKTAQTMQNKFTDLLVSNDNSAVWKLTELGEIEANSILAINFS